jgi:glutamate-1-semialdehyde 2,1-aminomutase
MVFPGGDTRLAAFYSPYPAAIERADGIELEDLDGNRYADFLLNYTSLIMGHRHPAVMEAAAEMIGRLTGVAAPAPAQLELAEEIVRRVGSVERVRFTNSGTESNQIAVWAARAYTGRPGLIKAIGGYHGSIPDLDKNIRPGFLPPGVSEAAPVQAVPFNDADALRAAVEESSASLAAVVLEPVLGSGGVVPPEPGYLETARSLTAQVGALLILDEVITFRLGPGGYQEIVGVSPDLTAFAKIIGGGFPVGALGGREDVMDVFRSGAERFVGHSGTFNGNPVTTAAGLKVLELLDAAAYDRLDRLGAALADGLNRSIERTGVQAQVTRVGSIGNVHFTTEPIRDYDAAQRSDPVAAAAYHLALMNRGVFIANRGMFALSTVTEEADVQKFVDASEEIFEALS